MYPSPHTSYARTAGVATAYAAVPDDEEHVYDRLFWPLVAFLVAILLFPRIFPKVGTR